MVYIYMPVKAQWKEREHDKKENTRNNRELTYLIKLKRT